MKGGSEPFRRTFQIWRGGVAFVRCAALGVEARVTEGIYCTATLNPGVVSSASVVVQITNSTGVGDSVTSDPPPILQGVKFPLSASEDPALLVIRSSRCRCSTMLVGVLSGVDVRTLSMRLRTLRGGVGDSSGEVSCEEQLPFSAISKSGVTSSSLLPKKPPFFDATLKSMLGLLLPCALLSPSLLMCSRLRLERNFRFMEIRPRIPWLCRCCSL
mmetsp:Transcript_10076/g.38149  ORF Transcript_10076/g.38149 Transcript_10076/m.38149 type:complete len:215 (+) Transcript_10076:498-1142(+)